MPRTFLVKKFKRQDVSSVLRINIPVKEEERTKLERNDPNFLPSHKEACKRDSEVKGHFERKKSPEGMIFLLMTFTFKANVLSC